VKMKKEMEVKVKETANVALALVAEVEVEADDLAQAVEEPVQVVVKTELSPATTASKRVT
jgi:hypothetical protein